MASFSFIYPVFSNHLLTKYGIGVETSSLFFVIAMFTYFIMIKFLNKVSRASMKLLITVGLSVNACSVLFLGPVSFLPQSIFVIVMGLALLGASGGCITVPSLIDLIETLKNELNLDENAANDISSGNFNFLILALFNLALNIGEAIGPIAGGAITHYYSFDTSCYSMGLLNFVYLIIFVYFNLSKIKINDIIDNKKDKELDYEYREIKPKSKTSENMEHHTIGRYRAFSFASESSKFSL